MNRLIDCITQEHDFALLVIAVVVCITGSCLSILLSQRLRSATPERRRIQLVLSGILTGATVWSTHFIAMLAYDPGVVHGYAPVLTAVSFGVAVFGTLLANIAFTYRRTLGWSLFSGGLFGGAVGLMHYIGMQAYQIPGDLIMDGKLKLVSLVAGIVLGAAAFHRVAYPITRHCWLGGAVLMSLCICTLHLIGMSSVQIQLSPFVSVPPQVISDEVLGAIVFGVTAIILFVGFAAHAIETRLEEEAARRLTHTSLHDHLTGILNRRGLADWLIQRTKDASADRIVVISFDLDHFKAVNDLYGLRTGDHVLQTIARRLASTGSENNAIARTGGDSFTAIQIGLGAGDDATALATRLQQAIQASIEHEGDIIRLTTSIGVATGKLNREDFDVLCQQADFALSQAKRAQSIQIVLYDAEVDAQSREKLMLVKDLREAIKNNQFELAYQLQHELTNLQPIGCEVLLRWRHPERGMIPPCDFIPVAEETGLISEIGLWVLRTACFEAASWDEPLSIAVNVAPQQLIQPSFLEDLADALIDSKLPAERLELEVTEASVISDLELTLKIITSIKAMGIRIAMDDFGTGYSSLATLQMFPFDKIKIDRSFVMDLDQNEQRAAIVRATLLLGTSLKIPVLAEGVEAETELRFLQEEGCAFVQGFYFGTPLDLEGIRAIARGQQSDVA